MTELAHYCKEDMAEYWRKPARREQDMLLFSFPFFIQIRIPAHWMAPPKFKANLWPLVKPLWKLHHRHPRCVPSRWFQDQASWQWRLYSWLCCYWDTIPLPEWLIDNILTCLSHRGSYELTPVLTVCKLYWLWVCLNMVNSVFVYLQEIFNKKDYF